MSINRFFDITMPVCLSVLFYANLPINFKAIRKNIYSIVHIYIVYHKKRECYSRLARLSYTRYSASENAIAKFHTFSRISIDFGE